MVPIIFCLIDFAEDSHVMIIFYPFAKSKFQIW